MEIKQDFRQQEMTSSALENSSVTTAQPFLKKSGELEQLLHSQQLTASLKEPVHALAEVTEVLENESGIEEAYLVKFNGLQYLCEKAASCLLMPRPGDSVLISGPDGEHVYIIAIIKQATPEQSEVLVSGHLSFKAEQFSIQAKQQVALQSEHLKLKAETAQCVVDTADYVGRELRSTISITRIVAKAYEVIADRLSQMSRNTFRITEQVEQARAGTIDYQAEDSARIHSKYTMVTGKELVKVDSEQIHMG